MATDSEYKLGEEEPKIPVFTVLKNGAILKNIFIVNNNNSDHDSLEPEQILIVGRHPDCNVMLTHPSISRFHLQILSNPSLQKLSVIDLSSVHGTWVSEKKIDPWARIELCEGDSLRIGGSSRVYRLHWIPLRQAYDFETPYASASDALLTEENGEEVLTEACQDEDSLPNENEPVEEEANIETLEKKAQEEEFEGNNSLFMENEEIQSLDMVVEGMSSLFSEENLGITVKKEIPSAPPMPENPVYFLFEDDDECIQSTLEDFDGPSFGTESRKLSLPFEGVILDTELAESGKDSQSLEPSMMSKFVGGRECPEQDISIVNEEKSDLAAAPALVFEKTENQSLFLEDVGQTDKSLLQVGGVIGETENQHDIKELDLEAPYASDSPSYKVGKVDGKTQNQNNDITDPDQEDPYALESPSHKGKQETENQSLFTEDFAQTNKSPLKVGEVDGKTRNQNNDITDPDQEDLYASESPPSHKAKKEHSRACYDEVPPATGSLEETEEQKLCLEDHEEKDVSTEYCTSYMKGSGSSTFPAEEVLLKISDVKENRTPQSFYEAAGLPQSEKIRNSPIRSENTPVFGSIWSRRGKPANVIQLQTGRSRGETMVDAVNSECEQNILENMQDKPISKGIFPSLDKKEEENFTSNKDYFTPKTLLVKSSKKDKLASVSQLRNSKTRVESMMASADSGTEQQKDIFSCLDGEEEEEIITPDKENFTPNTLLVKSSKKDKLASVSQLRNGKTRVESMMANADSGTEQQKDIFSCLDGEEEEIFTPNKENFTPNTLLVKSLKKKSKLASVSQLRSNQGRAESMLTSADSEGEQHNQEAAESKSISRENFSCLDHEEEDIFTRDKENVIPNTLLGKSSKKKGELVSANQLKTSKSRVERRLLCADSEDEQKNQEDTEDKSISKESFSCLIVDDEEIFTPDKENFTPNTLLGKSSKKKGELASANQLKTSKSRVERRLFCADSEDEQKNQEATEDKSISKESFSCLLVDDEEIFTPDKENFTPNTLLQKSLKKKKGKLEEVKHFKQYGSSSPRLTFSPNMHTEQDLIVLPNKENRTLRVLQELKPEKQPVSWNQVKLEQELMFNKRRQERVPFQSLVVNTVGKTRSDTLGFSSASKSNSSVNYTQNAEKKFTNPLPSNSIREAKRSWTMVVDTTTLLNKESRKSLQLLEGLRGTRLIIPRMVIKELDCLKRRGSLFRRKTEACLVLEWIEQCMVEKSWWIHVQSSAEDVRLTAPTPPTSPQSPTTSSLPFLSQWSLMEIASPTTEDHILECSLLCRKMMSDRHLVLLSDDITLKIKAMAEGLICETVREFRESLMNPFSERFLWVDSSPRGQTWSVLDDVVLREKYNRFPLRKSLKGESAKGLKLILLHNSHYGQRTLIS